MTPSNSKSDVSQGKVPNSTLTPFNCFSNGVVLGAIATALYFLTRSVIEVYAHKPVYSDNAVAIRMSVAVKTVVVGLCMMGTAVFGFIALGLVLLGIKLLIQALIDRNSSSSES
ncbi:MAG: DUF3082 domain-containing protein [Microcoleaceae cyanobacterium]